MSLPVYKTLEYTTTLPITKTKVVFRPYTVGDERNLLAAESARESDPEFYINNTVNVIQNSIISPTDLDIKSLPAADVKYLILSQRAKSVGEVIEFLFEDKPHSVHIDDFKIVGARSKDDYKIDVGQGFGILLRDLTFAGELEAAKLAAKIKDDPAARIDAVYAILFDCIHSIYDQENVWVVGTDITMEAAREFVYSLPNSETKELFKFIEEFPQLAVDITTPDGRQITLKDSEVNFLA